MALERESAALAQAKAEQGRAEQALRESRDLTNRLQAETNEKEQALEKEKTASEELVQQWDEAVTAKGKAETATNEAKRNLELSQSLRLAGEAARLANTPSYAVGGLLAVEAVVQRPVLRGGGAALESVRSYAKQALVLRGHEDRVLSGAWSPDGKAVLTASSDKTARIWKADGTGEPIVLRGHENSVNSGAWSPDGKAVLTASSDKTARIWSSTDGTLITTLRGHQGAVWNARFSPDGRRFVTVSEDKTAGIWLTDPTTLIPGICRGVGRNLTKEEWARYIPDRPYRETCAKYLTKSKVKEMQGRE